MASPLYKSLDASTDEFRLLEILRAKVRNDDDGSDGSSGDEIVSCRLFTTPLSESIRYAALSYVWGDASVTEDIIVNGTIVPVTVNLAAALKRLRNNDILVDSETGDEADEDNNSGRPRLLPLWVDAICINQNDIAERNNQVHRIKDIYGKAQSVISWLGEPDEYYRIDLIFGVMRALRSYLQALGDVEFREYYFNAYEWLGKQASLCQFDTPGSVGNMTWNAFEYLATSNYWTRIWVVQEIAAARSPDSNIVVFGSERIALADIREFIDLSKSIDRNANLPPSGMPGRLWQTVVLKSIGLSLFLYMTKTWNNAWNFYPGVTLVPIASLQCTATDPRDMIYGLQGIVKIDISIDYNKSVREVYLDWAKVYFDEVKDVHPYGLASDFALLSGVGVYGYKNEDNLPSWMPQLSNIMQHYEYYNPIGVALDSADTLLHFKLPMPVVIRDGILKMHCVVSDKVVEAFPVEKQDSSQFSSSFFISICIEIIVRMGHCRYFDGLDAPSLEALYRIMYLNLRLDNYKNARRQLFELSQDPYFYYGFLNLLKTCADDLPEAEMDEALTRVGLSSREQMGQFLEDQLTDYEWGYKLLMKALCDEDLFPEYAERIKDNFMRLQCHAFFKTAKGNLSIGPYGVQPGDRVCLINDIARPTLFRRIDDHWVYVGQCFILGVPKAEIEAIDESMTEQFLVH
ncbi:heterokaryon incompatibility protein-domain-containing protein [Xylariaceae sp. FL0662B]|nr:heterokaryon incompatibility protein-domain-containing protein [Xylariaceae sp. FL0662B]